MKSIIKKVFLGLLFALSTSPCFGMENHPDISDAEIRQAQLETAINTRILAEDVIRRNEDRGFSGWLSDHITPVTLGGAATLLCLGKYHRLIKRLISYVGGNCLSDYAQIPDLCNTQAILSTAGLLALEPTAIIFVLYLVYRITKLTTKQKLLLASSLTILGVGLAVAWL